MPFSLRNEPSTFIRVMIQTLKSFLSRCVVVYFNDVFIFSQNVEEHLEHLKQILKLP
jgi:hypothetical protein